MKKKFNPSAALGYKRIKPLYDKAVSDLVEAERTISAQGERLEFQFCEAALLDAKIDRQKDKLKRAGDRVAELLRFARAQNERTQQLGETLSAANNQLVIEQGKRLSSDKMVSLQQRNQFLAKKNLELAQRGDKYRAELENIRVKGAYAIITVGVLALGYALVVLQ
ncbi:hypothetical protein ST21_020 [Aeromonas phage ST21]|uniref:Uncharacterized protein n=1 Tax=Aeromonas phage ST21 TaxID=3065691 RepID=A0AA96EUU4_9CAUD|nr:hypothetical protein ST21_020 [Aeromonas phage ST21]